MNVDTSKTKLMVVIMFFMAAYFLGINYLKKIDEINDNNTYHSLNLVQTSKEDFLEEYIQNIQNKNYVLAYSMLDEESKLNFENDYENFEEYASQVYKGIAKNKWKFKYVVLNEKNLKDKNIYNLQVLDPEKDDAVLIKNIKVYEYAVNVFKISLV